MIRPGLQPLNGPTELLITFVIIGGGIAGLSSAISLSRVGHKVIVLERCTEDEIEKMSHGGIRLPPNGSKVLFQWGLKESLKAISVTSEAIEMDNYENGEFLGSHLWDDEIIEQTGGEFLLLHYADLRQLLLTTARASGAEIHHGAKVLSVDCDQGHVKLSTGATYWADVIIGADGPSSLIQKTVSREDPYGSTESHCLFYNTTVPARHMLNDPELASLYNRKHATTFVWLGNNASAIGFRVACKDEFALHFWFKPSQPQSGRSADDWGPRADPSELRKLLKRCEPRLVKMARVATVLARAQVKMASPLNDWVHENGHVMVLGDAAHLLPTGSIQTAALALEDAAVLGRLFSHLSDSTQIPHFLYALQELREDRCASVLAAEQGNLAFQMMPPGLQRDERDQMLKERLVSGTGLFGWGTRREESDEEDEDEDEDEEDEEREEEEVSAGESGEESVEDDSDDDDDGPSSLAAQWDQMHLLFGYEAEDVADEWWVKSGMLRERAEVRLKDLEEMMKERARLRLKKAVAFDDDDD